MLFQTLLLASTASATCLHGLSKFKRAEAVEGEVQVSTFGYEGLLGPLNWASLAPENEACKTGKLQSPINIDGVIAFAQSKPTLDIPEQEVEFENLGTTIEVIVNGTTSFAGSDFRLRQFHIHTPSEHHINGEYFPLEIHMVHEGVTDPNSLAVIALPFQLSAGAADPLIAGLQPHLAAIAQPGTKTKIESLDFSNVANHVQSASELFQYTGSLTTPPCAEGLTFLVAQTPLSIDVATYNEIKSIVKFNSRFTQNEHSAGANLIEVAQKAGTAEQFNPPARGGAGNSTTGSGNTTATATVKAAAPLMTKGQTIRISEIEGQPTDLVGVIVKKH
ncbi:alpha carbonic anhydrase [Dendryphion nanum]|uniref:Carbonic anhydrase n=1 Tax=Dendryphion nanum TaxID=256645 RepID=A0A9P9DXA2_9PLEO|nr:alpha carbonic anhydrase [Dendryphion nanum]